MAGNTDFTFITERLATGAAINDLDDVKNLITSGITHIIDCRDDFNDAPLLVSTVAGKRAHYLWNGTPDDGQPKPASWFDASIRFGIHALSLRHTKVYAHCAAGVNRGPSTLYAIMIALSIPADVAEQMIRTARPQVQIAYKADADKAVAADWK